MFVKHTGPVLGGVEELAAEVGGAWVGFGEPDLGFLAEVGAPGGVVGEEAAAEADEDGGVGRVWRRIWALARWRTRCSRWLRTLSRWEAERRCAERRNVEEAVLRSEAVLRRREAGGEASVEEREAV
ncbi:hypothetical protein Scep_019138 [Stephania cephalantha]|uniref:Uncharacterized protein n=1 Tax=Stephania cephalantha TaxID=152367 RepID=A0AAP0IA65_9MAGN